MRLDDRGNIRSIEEVFVKTRMAVAYFQNFFDLTNNPMKGLGAPKEMAVICFDGGGCHPRSVRPKQIGWPCTAWQSCS